MEHESRAETQRWYIRANWRRLRNLQLKTSPLCAMCLHTGTLTVATVVDHITPRSKGGADYDPDNLQSLCAECHSQKTTRDQGRTDKPMKGWNADANAPVDPDASVEQVTRGKWVLNSEITISRNAKPLK